MITTDHGHLDEGGHGGTTDRSENPGSSRGARTGNCQSGLKKLRRMSWQN
ncbi:hypothetical protein ACMG4H_09785 [Corynebacterium glutamicum]